MVRRRPLTCVFAEGGDAAAGSWSHRSGSDLPGPQRKRQGDPLIWDPFRNNNVKPGDEIEIEVCLYDADSGQHSECNEHGDVSTDG